jgi:hemerythrin-like metal-binding protein
MATLPSSLRTGVALIDKEHEYLLDLVDRLKRMCNYGPDDCEKCGYEKWKGCDGMVCDMMGELLIYMLEHFRHEEKLMTDAPSILKELHIEDHANLSKHLADALRNNDPGRTLLRPSDLENEISQWLGRHITKHDVPFSTYFASANADLP